MLRRFIHLNDNEHWNVSPDKSDKIGPCFVRGIVVLSIYKRSWVTLRPIGWHSQLIHHQQGDKWGSLEIISPQQESSTTSCCIKGYITCIAVYCKLIERWLNPILQYGYVPSNILFSFVQVLAKTLMFLKHWQTKAFLCQCVCFAERERSCHQMDGFQRSLTKEVPPRNRNWRNATWGYSSEQEKKEEEPCVKLNEL